MVQWGVSRYGRTVVDAETGHRDVSIGEAGELVVRGPQVTGLLEQREAETRAVLRDGWFVYR